MLILKINICLYTFNMLIQKVYSFSSLFCAIPYHILYMSPANRKKSPDSQFSKRGKGIFIGKTVILQRNTVNHGHLGQRETLSCHGENP